MMKMLLDHFFLKRAGEQLILETYFLSNFYQNIVYAKLVNFLPGKIL